MKDDEQNIEKNINVINDINDDLASQYNIHFQKRSKEFKKGEFISKQNNLIKEKIKVKENEERENNIKKYIVEPIANNYTKFSYISLFSEFYKTFKKVVIKNLEDSYKKKREEIIQKIEELKRINYENFNKKIN